MILVCDLGNTNVVFGLYDNDKCMDSFRLVSSKLMALDEYIAKLNTIVKDKNIDVSGVEGCIMSSVMPSIATKEGAILGTIFFAIGFSCMMILDVALG